MNVPPPKQFLSFPGHAPATRLPPLPFVVQVSQLTFDFGNGFPKHRYIIIIYRGVEI